MTREEFLSLPPTVALRLIFDSLDEETSQALLRQEKPKLPFPPKFDLAIYRAGGNMWASETALEGLLYWQGKYLQSANSGGQYAAQDQRRAEQIGRWIAWRECYPEAVWSGVRGDEEMVAKAPSAKPTVYPRAGNGQRRPPQQQQEELDPEADIPF